MAHCPDDVALSACPLFRGRTVPARHGIADPGVLPAFHPVPEQRPAESPFDILLMPLESFQNLLVFFRVPPGDIELGEAFVLGNSVTPIEVENFGGSLKIVAVFRFQTRMASVDLSRLFDESAPPYLL